MACWCLLKIPHAALEGWEWVRGHVETNEGLGEEGGDRSTKFRLCP